MRTAVGREHVLHEHRELSLHSLDKEDDVFHLIMFGSNTDGVNDRNAKRRRPRNDGRCDNVGGIEHGVEAGHVAEEVSGTAGDHSGARVALGREGVGVIAVRIDIPLEDEGVAGGKIAAVCIEESGLDANEVVGCLDRGYVQQPEHNWRRSSRCRCSVERRSEAKCGNYIETE